MNDDTSPTRSLRERLGGNAEERLGRALSELLESPLFTGAIGRAFDAREKAAQAQVLALGALNLPSAADIERLTRRVRSVSQRLEAIEDGVERLDTSARVSERGAPAEIEARLGAIEQQLSSLGTKLDALLKGLEPGTAAAHGGNAAGSLPRSRPSKAKPRPKATAEVEPAAGG